MSTAESFTIPMAQRQELKAFMVPMRDIIVPPERGRLEFTRLIEMADSIKRFGLIHPIVVTNAPDKPGKYRLIAGERRYRGAILAGCVSLPATLKENCPSWLQAEIELEENVCRRDLSNEEEGRLFLKIKTEKLAAGIKWTDEQTAGMVNLSRSDVSAKVQVVKEFDARPDFREATKGLPLPATLKKIKQIKEAERIQRLADSGEIQLTHELRLGDCRTLIKSLETASVDVVVTDPPYGLAKMEALRESGTSRMFGHSLMSDTHNQTLDKVLEILRDLAPELARVLKPGAHWYMFCGFQHVGDFIKALEPFLEFQPPLVIWDRGKPSSPGFGYNYLSRAEAIIYGYRPPVEERRRLNEQIYNIIPCPDVPKDLRIYPTEKPQPLLQTLIKQSTSKNQMVLDPFAGSASTLLAARESGRRAIGFEIDNNAFLRAQKRLLGKD